MVLMLYVLFSWDAWSVSVCVTFQCYIVILLLYLMRFPRFWFVTLFFCVHGLMSFEQRYTTVAFIYIVLANIILQ